VKVGSGRGDSTDIFIAERSDLFHIKNAFLQHPRYIIFNQIYANKALYVGNPKNNNLLGSNVYEIKTHVMESNINIINNNKRCVHKSIPVNRTVVGRQVLRSEYGKAICSMDVQVFLLKFERIYYILYGRNVWVFPSLFRRLLLGSLDLPYHHLVQLTDNNYYRLHNKILVDFKKRKKAQKIDCFTFLMYL
jgi:hypothetical protein